MAHSKAAPKTNMFIATPMFGGMCSGPYAASIFHLTYVFMSAQVPVVYDTKYNQSLITRARDSLAADFMDSECSHLMFIDADIEFQAEDILSMVAADKDVLCGIYPRKQLDWEQVAQAVHDGIPTRELPTYSGTFPIATLDGKNITEVLKNSDQKPVEVKYASTGFMLIKRSVLEAIADKVPEYLSNADHPDKGRFFKQYFDTSIDAESKNLLSEDYYFCTLVRNNGFKVWVAPWAQLNHIGTFPYTGRAIHPSI
jgi:hypothetical protein